MWVVSVTLTVVAAALAAVLPLSLGLTVVLECTAATGPEVGYPGYGGQCRHLRTKAAVLREVAVECPLPVPSARLGRTVGP